MTKESFLPKLFIEIGKCSLNYVSRLIENSNNFNIQINYDAVDEP